MAKAKIEVQTRIMKSMTAQPVVILDELARGERCVSNVIDLSWGDGFGQIFAGLIPFRHPRESGDP